MKRLIYIYMSFLSLSLSIYIFLFIYIYIYIYIVCPGGPWGGPGCDPVAGPGGPREGPGPGGPRVRFCGLLLPMGLNRKMHQEQSKTHHLCYPTKIEVRTSLRTESKRNTVEAYRQNEHISILCRHSSLSFRGCTGPCVHALYDLCLSCCKAQKSVGPNVARVITDNC